jgi:hypothetical protein
MEEKYHFNPVGRYLEKMHFTERRQTDTNKLSACCASFLCLESLEKD